MYNVIQYVSLEKCIQNANMFLVNETNRAVKNCGFLHFYYVSPVAQNHTVDYACHNVIGIGPETILHSL